MAADVVCRSIGDAVGLLLDDQALAATLHPQRLHGTEPGI